MMLAKVFSKTRRLLKISSMIRWKPYGIRLVVNLGHLTKSFEVCVPPFNWLRAKRQSKSVIFQCLQFSIRKQGGYAFICISCVNACFLSFSSIALTVSFCCILYLKVAKSNYRFTSLNYCVGSYIVILKWFVVVFNEACVYVGDVSIFFFL